MRIDSMDAAKSASNVQAAGNQPVDSISKNLQNEISNIQQQRRELSSEEDMSVEEKVEKRKELQKKINSLNVQLKQRQAELRKERQKENIRKALLEEESGAGSGQVKGAKHKDTENKENEIKNAENKGTELDAAESKDADNEDTKIKTNEEQAAENGIPPADMQEIVAGDFDMEQAKARGIVIARMEEGIVLLKGEINQDELRGVDVGRRQAQLEKQEQKLQAASAFQFPDLGGAQGMFGPNSYTGG